MSTKFFTNEKDNTLLRKFKGIFENTNVHQFDALVGYFRASGYFDIKNVINNISEIRILVGINVDKIIKKYHKKGLEFNINKQDIIDDLIDEFKKDIQESNYSKNIEDGIVQFVQDISSKKIKISAHPTKNIHAKIYIFKPKSFNEHNPGSVISGSSNLTSSGLGSIQNSNYEFNVELRDYDDVKFASEEFDKLWEESIEELPLEDVIDNIKNVIEDTYILNKITPYELYYKLLIEYFSDTVDFDPQMPDDIPEGYKKLDYQIDAVNEGFSLIKRHGGFFLSDVVGTGKTIISTLIAKKLFFHTLANTQTIMKTLIIAPKTVQKDWEKVLSDFNLKNYEFLPNRSFHKLKEAKYNPESFHLIIVDEAHKFRSNTASSYNELQKLCKTSAKQDDGTYINKNIILISASPLNNKPMDIKNQLLLFQNGKNSTLEIHNLDDYFNEKQKQYEKIINSKSKRSIKDRLKSLYGDIRERIFYQIMVRRTRTDLMAVEQYRKNIEEQNLSIPEVGAPNKLLYKLDEKLSHLYDETITLFSELNYSIYNELDNLLERHKSKYNMPDVSFGALNDIMKTSFIKRLDSSIFALKKSLSNLSNKIQSKIIQFENKKIFVNNESNLNISQLILEDRENEIIDLFENNPDAGDIYTPEDFKKNYLNDLKSDLELLNPIITKWKNIDYDPKYSLLLDKVKTEFFDSKINIGNKIIIFSEAQATTDYLSKRLTADGYERILSVNGKNKSKLSSVLQSDFDQNYTGEKTNDYDILITTEVLGEGVNLHRSNIIINYDTPWNSTKLIQRIGRVNRIGTKASKIHIYNFFPSSNVDDDIKLENRAYLKLQGFHEALGEDNKIFHDEEETKSYEIFDHGIEEQKNEKLTYLMELRDYKKNNPNDFRRLKNLSPRQRCARSNNKHSSTTIAFIKNNFKNSFYSINNENEIKDMTFIECARAYKADKDEPSMSLPDYHHLHVQNAVNFFENEKNTQLIKNNSVKNNVKGVASQAIKFLDACSNIKSLSKDEISQISLAKKSIKNSQFIELQREILRFSRNIKENKMSESDLIDRLLAILRNYPLNASSNENNVHLDKIFSDPKIIISETFT